MRVAMVGTGYVGLVTGTCFAEMGNTVTCVDTDARKIECLQRGEIPFYEPGLKEMVTRNFAQQNLRFTTKIEEALERSEICFIAVGTPMGEDGSADLQYVLAVAKEIGQYMQRHMVVVDKSTVPVGTADKVRAIVQAELDARGSDLTFDVVSNPEFLKEGNACVDFMQPDRVVIGADSPRAVEVMQELYAPFFRTHERFIAMDVRSAELTKYAANAMLATKISFINEIANLCERVGADVNKVRIGIGSDSRIGYKFIYPGCGYGGSCFPKDIRALIRTGESVGYAPRILQAVEAVNEDQKQLMVRKVVETFGEDLTGKTFGIWGLSYKPETSDMREAPAIEVIRALTQRGAQVRAYDPQAMEEAQNCYLQDVDGVSYMSNKYDALNGADGMLLLTEWKEFRSPDYMEMAQRMRGNEIFDGRNQYKESSLKQHGFKYHAIGVQAAE